MPTKPTRVTGTKNKTVKKTKPAKEKAAVKVEVKEVKEVKIKEKDLKLSTEEPVIEKKNTDSVQEERPSQVSPKGEVTSSFEGEKYYESIGRRKEAIARVRVFTRKSTDLQATEETAIIIVNGKPYFEYFNNTEARNAVEAPLKKLKSMNRFKASVKVSGGGVRGQAEATKFGLSRALVLFDANFAKKLKKAGFLSRDARVKERRKYGLKKARKSPQWSKR